MKGGGGGTGEQLSHSSLRTQFWGHDVEQNQRFFSGGSSEKESSQRGEASKVIKGY